MLSCKTFFQTYVSPKMKTLVIVLTPLLLLPLIFNGAEARAGYCVLLMTIFWLTSALPEAVTSLLPIVLFPLLDILSTSEVCALYIKQSNIVFFGGVVLALGVERSNLHRRIALRVILTFGTNPRWLMLGFMSVSMSLSLWISNSGVTAMLIPIVNAVVDELFHDSMDVEMGANSLASQHSSIVTLQETGQPTKQCSRSNDIKQKVKVPFLIAVSYAASLGGTGTLIGSGAPLAFKGIFEE
ncbi:I'M NOT DEAD yet protein [Daphnia magna]|uniref:I'M NOT DEAD yet protein n=1 Tax=Daphnia magna TaxID=35525 RepID=A0A164SCK4_9CRUS|nr:I'M NOT DEAD yet protein [Daphnia magna]